MHFFEGRTHCLAHRLRCTFEQRPVDVKQHKHGLGSTAFAYAVRSDRKPASRALALCSAAVTSLALLIAGIVPVIAGAELLLDGLLGVAAQLEISPFVLTVVFSGFELENLAAGIAANAKGLPGAAAGTFLGGTTFLALAVAGGGALIAPINANLPRAAPSCASVPRLRRRCNSLS